VKRAVAIAFVAAVLALAAGAILGLSTPWTGERLCRIAEERVRAATGLELAVEGCRVEPFRLGVRTGAVRLGPAAAPVFTADGVQARLAPVQALGRRLELAELVLERPRVTARVPATPPDAPAVACPPPALQRFQVHRLTVREGAVDVTLPRGERVVVARLDVAAAPVSWRRGLAALAPHGARRTGLEVRAAGLTLEAGARRLALSEASARADLALDLSRLDLVVASAEMPGASAVASGTILDLCRPRLDLAVAGRGELAALLAAAGRPAVPAAGAVALDVAVTGPAARPVIEGEVRLERADLDGWRMGDARARLRLEGERLDVARLTVSGETGGSVSARGTVRLGSKIGLEAEAQLDRVELGELLGRLQLPHAWVMARVGGKVRVTGTAAPLALAGDVALELADFRVLDHGWEAWRGERGFLQLARAGIEGALRVDRAGVHLEGTHVHAGRGALATRGLLAFDGDRGFELTCAGEADLDALGRLGTLQLGGRARLDGVVVRAAPYGLPRVEGRVRVQGLRFLDLDLGDASAAVSHDRYLLRVAGADGVKGQTRWSADVGVRLDKDPPLVQDGRWEIRGRLRDAFEAVMPWLPDAVHARDALDAEVTARGTAHGPAPALDVDFDAELGRGALLRRAFESGRLAGAIERGVRARFDVAELRRGRGVVRGRGHIGLEAPFAWQLETSFAGVALAHLDLPGEAWAGAVAGSAALEGSWEAPRVRFSGEGQGIAVQGVPVGAVRLSGRLEGAALSLDGHTEGVTLTAHARTDGDLPFEADAELDVADVTRFLPGGPPAGLRASVRGTGHAAGSLRDVAAARAALALSQVRGGYGDFAVDNAAPVELAVEARRVTLRALSLHGTNTAFTLGGAREPSGALALDARGTLDLRLLGGLLPGVAEPRGRLELEAHVAGTAASPTLVGSGHLQDGGFRLREAPVAFTGLSGDLAFSQDRMLFDGLQARVNGGRADLSGEVELVRFVPARVRIAAGLEEVSLRIPEWLPSVLSGRLQATGTFDAMLLSGKMRVLQARYREPVDLEKRLVEVRRKPLPERAFDRAGEWLSFDVGLAVDGDARIENDLVRAGLRGSLTLTGTLAAPGLIGTLTLTDGSRGTFRGNEFRLTHGVVDFTERRRIRMTLDVHGDAQVRDYRVFMHVTGPYEEPALQLTSEPALPPQDVVTLLSLGWVSRDVAAASGVSGVAAAAAAQALVSASGLDEQVKRFVPRNDVLHDLSLRITSAYSEGSGQVEPRAEFESQVLDDRFRLRYQAPLGGTRSQRAQAEMRLGPRISLQYQWDNDSPEVASGGDHGVDLKLRWEWND
jgi:translocation and assembly module TamB